VWSRRLGSLVPKILVADDNTNIQKMVALAFEERGVNVTSVGNGEAAVRRIPDLNPDLVLADVFMPVRNGYEVCEFVKKDDRFSHVPVILLVGAFDPLDEKEARRVGADGVLKKPFVPPDPLIAMVMSALEKNPKVAAELAKAREAAVAPPPEPPLPAMEIPAQAEPKPLPEYPEPTPEEAAQIYGFGKGVRTIDEAEEESQKAPKPDAAEESEEVEEFDGAATASDWRRSAADFEVPEEMNSKLAFAPDEEFSASSFPSERDVPPRKIRVEEPAEEIQPVVVEEAPGQPVSQAQSPSPLPAVVESQPVYASRVEAPVPPPDEAPAPEQEDKGSSSPISKAAHWMDMMAPASAENSNGGGWIANLLGLRKEKEPEAGQIPPETAKAPESPESLPYQSQYSMEPVAEEAVPEEAVPEESVAAPSHRLSAIDENKDAPEPTPETVEASSSRQPWSLPPAPAQEALEQSVPESVPALLEAAPAAPAEQFSSDSSEIEKDSDESEPSLRDPMLVEPPAVHVDPEPLLINEEDQVRAEYGVPREQVTPLHSFFSPASGDPFVDEPAAPEPAARTEFPSFEAAPVAPSSDEFEPRIPTAPPPNREALSSIPFLNPPIPAPQEIHAEEAPVQSAPATDSSTVDAVVQKVLEKLGPQLNQILSQNVLKPLVENMLQQDLQKKDK
jgi:CheY-like chemotaxis protein